MGSLVDTALDLVGPCPASLATTTRLGARGTADRGIPAIVQRIIRKVIGVDVAPDVLPAPVDQRVELPDPAPLVPLHLRRARPRGRLLTPDSGDPRVDSAERALQCRDLGRSAAVGDAPRLAGAA